MRHTATVGILAALLTMGAAEVRIASVASSARQFKEYFCSLDGQRTALNPVERLVFSLLLTDAGRS